MDKQEKIETPTFTCTISPSMKWIRLKRPFTEAYRVRFGKEGNSYNIDIEVLEGNGASLKELTEEKFSKNNHSAFSAENISPFKLLNQEAGLTAWSCRYRWVDGGTAPYRKQDVFMEIKDKKVHFSFMAAPEKFDLGLVEFLNLVRSVQPI